jgi:SAM-dependent methyltransferase
MLKMLPESEHDKLLHSEHELYYKDYGVDFCSTYQCFDSEFEWKEPTTSRKVFDEIIEKIPINKSWVFLDIGCGLGHVMYMASSHFDTVYGVEIIDEVAEIAKQNLAKLLPENKSCNVLSGDMFELDKKIINLANVFYISSPFMEEDLFDKLVKMILNSLSDAEREIWIIYYYPYCEHIMDKYRDIFPMVDSLESIGKINFYHHRRKGCHKIGNGAGTLEVNHE